MIIIAPLISGIIFGAGLAISGMLDPSKVAGFWIFWCLGSFLSLCYGRRCCGEWPWVSLDKKTK